MNKIEIISLQNELVKYCVKLQNSSFRKKEGMILLDGIKSIEGAVEKGYEFEYLFVKDENNLKRFKNIKLKKLIITDDKVLKKISTTTSAPEYAAIVNENKYDKNAFFEFKKIALIEDIKDPGNLGTIIRSAAAFRVEGVILFGNCVDLYNTKTIRSSAANIFKIPVIQTDDIEFIKKLKSSHKLISTVVNSKKSFADCDFSQKYILAFGCEACGLSEKILKLSDEKLTIFMSNNVESLNLGVCASIAFALTDIL